MMPIKNRPFYVMEAWPIVNNTQGGPEHDVKQRVLDPMKKPIPRSTSPARSARSTAIFILEVGQYHRVLVAGKIAGQNAAAEQVWE